MSTEAKQDEKPKSDRVSRLEAYRLRADSAIALVSAFYLVLLFIPRALLTSWDPSTFVTVLDVIFWIIITLDLSWRAWLARGRRRRWPMLAGVALLLSGPFVFLSISQETRDLIRVSLIAVVAVRAMSSVRYFFRLRSMMYIIASVIIMVVSFGALISVTERNAPGASITSFGLGMWWAVVTVATVGYGDVVPVTNAGRVIGTALIFFGVAMFSVLTATLANSFNKRSEQDSTAKYETLRDRLDHVERHMNSRPLARRTRKPRRPARKLPPPRTGGPPGAKE